MEWVQQLSPRARVLFIGSLLFLFVVLGVFAANARRGSSADKALEAAFKKYPQLQRQPVAKFSGQVTIDGLPRVISRQIWRCLSAFIEGRATPQ